jgi:CheY-like chemotaxis protein
MDEFIKVLDAFSRLIAAAALPVALFAVIWLFRVQVRNLIDRTKSASVELPGGLKATISTEQAQAAGALAAAVTKAPTAGQDAHAMALDATAAASIVTSAVTPDVVQNARKATILWVDDNPDNNIFERQSLEAIGATFVNVTSTDEAMVKARAQRFDVVISDMSRGRDRTAGFKLLEQLRAAGIGVPYVIYAASTTPERRAEAKRRGALEQTNRPEELFRVVVSVIGKPS